jgi:hypothetical protein
VKELCAIRTNTKTKEKQVSVRWEGYKAPTWEPYHCIKEQLPAMLKKLERKLKKN